MLLHRLVGRRPGWAGVDVSTRLLPESVSKIAAHLVSLRDLEDQSGVKFVSSLALIPKCPPIDDLEFAYD